MQNNTRWVLLTGANSGIGFATLNLLVQNGYYVFAGAKDNNGIEFLNNRKQESVEPVLLDITNKEHIKNIVNKIQSVSNSGGKFYALINNAALAYGCPVEMTDAGMLRQMFEVNLFGVIELINSLLPIIRRDKGRIVNVSSTNAIISFPYLGIYSATKFALDAVTDALRLEMKEWCIPVSIIYPDVVKTPIFDKSIPFSYQRFESFDVNKQELYRSKFDVFVKAINKMVSKGVEPEVIAKCILKCLNSNRPKPSYVPENNGKLSFVLRRTLSKKMMDKVLLKLLN